ncbi:MAG: hypothetical protein IJ300_05965, partial [Clostridia bacterium]|nr:hypothetical protein [Clostridia bacterium]
HSPANETKVICDAERIVNEYLKRNGYCARDNTKVYNNKKKPKKRLWSIATVITILVSFFSILYNIR